MPIATMVEAARARGLDAFVADAEALDLEGQATASAGSTRPSPTPRLHWMLDPDAVATGVFGLLKPGGRFAGEMGGGGNLAILAGLREELVERGYQVPDEDPQWYPRSRSSSGSTACAGFTDIQA